MGKKKLKRVGTGRVRHTMVTEDSGVQQEIIGEVPVYDAGEGKGVIDKERADELIQEHKASRRRRRKAVVGSTQAYRKGYGQIDWGGGEQKRKGKPEDN